MDDYLLRKVSGWLDSRETNRQRESDNWDYADWGFTTAWLDAETPVSVSELV